jgi:hypothetical protein
VDFDGVVSVHHVSHDIQEAIHHMQRVFLFGLSAVAFFLTLSNAALASGPNPDNYSLRVHILKYASRSAPSHGKNLSGMQDFVDGQGVADLFENGEPRGFEFTSSCTEPPMASSGYGSFPARWKKKEKTLEILLPQTGKPWNWESCDLRTEMAEGLVFFWKNGSLAVEAAKVLKEWMVKHQYNPEQGKDEPILPVGELPATGGTGPSDPQLAGPE